MACHSLCSLLASFWVLKQAELIPISVRAFRFAVSSSQGQLRGHVNSAATLSPILRRTPHLWFNMEDRIMPHTHIHTPMTRKLWICSSHVKGELRLPMTLRPLFGRPWNREIISDHPGEPSVIMMVLLSGRKRHKKRTRKMAAWGLGRTLLSLKMEKGCHEPRNAGSL